MATHESTAKIVQRDISQKELYMNFCYKSNIP